MAPWRTTGVLFSAFHHLVYCVAMWFAPRLYSKKDLLVSVARSLCVGEVVRGFLWTSLVCPLQADCPLWVKLVVPWGLAFSNLPARWTTFSRSSFIFQEYFASLHVHQEVLECVLFLAWTTPVVSWITSVLSINVKKWVPLLRAKHVPLVWVSLPCF